MLSNVTDWKTTIAGILLAIWAAGPSLVTAFEGGTIEWSKLINGLVMIIFGAIVRGGKKGE